MSTLIYHYGALGDFITALPSFARCRQIFPGPVTLLGKSSFGHLARQSGYVDTVLDADGSRHRFLFQENQSAGVTEAFWKQFDAALLFAADDAPVIRSARRFFPGTLHHQNPLPPRGFHAVDRHLALFPGVPPEPLLPVLHPGTPSHGSDALYRIPEPYIVIHPGSGSPRKNWPFDRFMEVAATMRLNGYRVVWLSGPAEREYHFTDTDTHFHEPPLEECVRVLAGAVLYLGNDSGITHCAAATGTNVVALFGPSDPTVWAPRGTGRIRILRHPAPSDCAPCHLEVPGIDGCLRDCITGITTSEVADVLLSLRYTSKL